MTSMRSRPQALQGASGPCSDQFRRSKPCLGPAALPAALGDQHEFFAAVSHRRRDLLL